MAVSNKLEANLHWSSSLEVPIQKESIGSQSGHRVLAWILWLGLFMCGYRHLANMFARGEWHSFVWIFSAPSQKSSYATVYARGLHIHRYLTNIISLSSWTQDCKVAPAFEIHLSLLLVHWKYWPCRLTIAKLEESRRISTTFLVSFMMALACNGRWAEGGSLSLTWS